jgi:hypothetical protein
LREILDGHKKEIISALKEQMEKEFSLLREEIKVRE